MKRSDRDLSAVAPSAKVEARSAKVDHLDHAIDQVAARLTHVDDNAALAARIISALPERVAWFGWLFRSWAPRLALIAVVVAGIVWGSRVREVSAPDASPIASSQPITTPTVLVASVREAAPNRTMPLELLERLEPLEPSERMEPTADFERSLAAIAAPESLVLGALAPTVLPASERMIVEPLALTDLPLTADFSPR
jgi:hypothetical protein